MSDVATAAARLIRSRDDLRRRRDYPPDLWQGLAEAGLLGLTVPEAYGGKGWDLERLAGGCRDMVRHGRSLGATWQRCRVHFARNLLAHAGKQGRRVVSAFVDTAFAQEDADSARAQWRQVADQLRPKVPKLAALMDETEHDVLAYMTFPREHRQKLHSTNPIERLHAEIKRRTNVVGIFPNEDAITRLVGAVLLEQNDEWAVSRRYMTLESIGPVSDNPTVKLPAVAAGASPPLPAGYRVGRQALAPPAGTRSTLAITN